jgi:hypothetical protein
MLAARSKVFRRMLYGEFAEAKKSVVEVWLQREGSKGDRWLYLHGYGRAVARAILSLIDVAAYFQVHSASQKGRHGLL